MRCQTLAGLPGADGSGQPSGAGGRRAIQGRAAACNGTGGPAVALRIHPMLNRAVGFPTHGTGRRF